MRNNNDRLRSRRGTGTVPAGWGYRPLGRDRSLSMTVPALVALLLIVFAVGFLLGFRVL